MDETQIAAIVDERLALVLPKSEALTMMRITPFRALDDDDIPIEVVGVSYQDEELNFIAIKERDGEIYPVMVSGAYPLPSNTT